MLILSIFTAINNKEKKRKENLTLHSMAIFFYKLTYWDKILKKINFISCITSILAGSCKKGTYHIGEQRRLMRSLARAFHVRTHQYMELEETLDK